MNFEKYTWGKDKPKTPGNYWWRESKKAQKYYARVIRVRDASGELWVQGDFVSQMKISEMRIEGEWALIPDPEVFEVAEDE